MPEREQKHDRHWTNHLLGYLIKQTDRTQQRGERRKKRHISERKSKRKAENKHFLGRFPMFCIRRGNDDPDHVIRKGEQHARGSLQVSTLVVGVFSFLR